MSKEHSENLLNEFEHACCGGGYEISHQLRSEIIKRVQELEGKITTLYEENCRLKNINTKHNEANDKMYADLKHIRRENKRYREGIKEAIEMSSCCGLTAGSMLNELLEGEE